MQVPELVGIAHHVDCRDLAIVDLEGGCLEFAISFSSHEARQTVDQGGADQVRPVLTEQHCQSLVYLHDMVVAEDRLQRCGPLAAAVRMHADIGSEHCAECGHVTVARSGKESVGDFKAALLFHPKTGSCFADVGPGTAGELSASGGTALDRHRDLLKINPEYVVEQEGGAFERREPLERKHKRQGDVLFLIFLDDRLRKPRADVDLSLLPR